MISLCCIVAGFTSCNVINPAEPIPAYISIDTIMLTTNLSSEGSASHKIVDAWVYVDNEAVGTYEMPAKFPVLAAGTHTISIQPGILLNGINATHLAYPYYQQLTKTVELIAGQEIKLSNLVTRYKEGLTFDLKEDFEGLIPFSPSDGSTVGMTIGSDVSQSFEGGYGVVKLDSGAYGFEIKSNQLLLPNNGTNIYLEMNYKNSAPFLVILQAEDAFGNSIKNSIITLNTKNEWNKIYIELRPTMLKTPDASKFRILFGTTRADASTKEEFYFDNVKVVHI